MVKAVIFASGPKDQNIESARALDAIVLAAAKDMGLAADGDAYKAPAPHGDDGDARVLYEVDDFSRHVAARQGFPVVEVAEDVADAFVGVHTDAADDGGPGLESVDEPAAGAGCATSERLPAGARLRCLPTPKAP